MSVFGKMMLTLFCRGVSGPLPSETTPIVRPKYVIFSNYTPDPYERQNGKYQFRTRRQNMLFPENNSHFSLSIFRPNHRLQNHSLWGGTYQLSFIGGLPSPPSSFTGSDEYHCLLLKHIDHAFKRHKIIEHQT